MDSDLVSKLHEAVDQNEVEQLKCLLDLAPEAVDWGDENDEAALVTASCAGNVDAVKTLIEQRGGSLSSKGLCAHLRLLLGVSESREYFAQGWSGPSGS